jgi:hypothetical protein
MVDASPPSLYFGLGGVVSVVGSPLFFLANLLLSFIDIRLFPLSPVSLLETQLFQT